VRLNADAERDRAVCRGDSHHNAGDNVPEACRGGPGRARGVGSSEVR
jgi:hypothetical protein